MKLANKEDVYALIDLNDGTGLRKIYLALKYDTAGRPYLIEDTTVKNI